MINISRERLFLGGETGSGKTHSWLTIAEALPDSKFVILEPDDGVRRLLEYQFHDLPNIEAHTVLDWPTFHAEVDSIKERVTEGKLTAKDWIVVEGLDIIMQFIRYEFLNSVYRGQTIRHGKESITVKSSWDAIIARRRANAPILEPSDYDGINMEYEAAMTYLAYRIPCNLIATTSVSRVDTGSRYESEEVKQFYRDLGSPFKFDGYKRNPRMFDTLIILSVDGKGYFFTVWKDRGSRGLAPDGIRGKRQGNENFFVDYLISVAGWSP